MYTQLWVTQGDAENHQIIDILPSRHFVDVARWLNKQPRAWKVLDSPDCARGRVREKAVRPPL